VDSIVSEELDGAPEEPVVIVNEVNDPIISTLGELSREELDRVFGIENDNELYDDLGGELYFDLGNNSQDGGENVDDNNIASTSGNPLS